MKELALSVVLPPGTLAFRMCAPEEVADGPNPAIPELQPLDRYAGVWDDEISERPEIERREIGEWVLGGRYLRQSWASESGEHGPRASGITMMTYDPASRSYRSWGFLADGTVIVNEGFWDESTKTLKWGHRTIDGEIVETTATFTSETTISWLIVKMSERGKMLREVSGRSTRRTLAGEHPQS